MEELTYENIRVTLDGHQLKQTNMKKFSMLQQLNDHGRVTLAGAVGEDSFIESLDETSVIHVDYVSSGNGTSAQASQQVVIPWFRGIVTNCTLSRVGREYNYEIEGASFTYLMDLKLKQRSFQDTTMTYQELVDEIAGEYKGVGSIGKVFDGKTLQQFILQYQETDWDFLKRIASHAYMPLVANSEVEKVNFCFGMPEGEEDAGTFNDVPYIIYKHLSDYRNSKHNFRNTAEELTSSAMKYA